MSGITVGPRQFNFMIPGINVAGGYVNNDQNAPYRAINTGGVGDSYYIEQKLDLRGMNSGSQDSRGMNPLSVQLQEAKPWFTVVNEDPPYEGLPTFMVYDLITTVPLNQTTLKNMFSYPQNATASVQGFLPDTGQVNLLEDPIGQVLNSSQVIWGRWRQMLSSRDFAQGATDKVGVRWGQSGTWGSGEVMVSNDVYFTRLIITENNNQAVFCPSTNVAVWAEVIALSEGQELTQLSRMVQR